MGAWYENVAQKSVVDITKFIRVFSISTDNADYIPAVDIQSIASSLLFAHKLQKTLQGYRAIVLQALNYCTANQGWWWWW